MNISDAAYVPRRTLSVQEAVNWLGVRPTKVYALFHRGELEGYQVGDRILIYADGVEEFKVRHANKRPRPQTTQPRAAARRPKKVTPSPVRTLMYL
jgi:excisionase family DNA binding protein